MGLWLYRFQSKKPGQKKAPGKAGQRYWKNVGLGFKTPKEAIEGQPLGRLTHTDHQRIFFADLIYSSGLELKIQILLQQLWTLLSCYKTFSPDSISDAGVSSTALQAHILTRSARSLATSPFVVVSCLALSSLQR